MTSCPQNGQNSPEKVTRLTGSQSLADMVVEIQCFSKAERNTKQRFKEERKREINKTAF